MNDLNELRNEIYDDAVAHGLWDCMSHLDNEEGRIASAHAIWRKVLKLLTEYERPGRYAEELADVIIMSLSVAGYLGIDIDKAVQEKMEINRGREWRHGK